MNETLHSVSLLKSATAFLLRDDECGEIDLRIYFRSFAHDYFAGEEMARADFLAVVDALPFDPVMQRLLIGTLHERLGDLQIEILEFMRAFPNMGAAREYEGMASREMLSFELAEIFAEMRG